MSAEKQTNEVDPMARTTQPTLSSEPNFDDMPEKERAQTTAKLNLVRQANDPSALDIISSLINKE